MWSLFRWVLRAHYHLWSDPGGQSASRDPTASLSHRSSGDKAGNLEKPQNSGLPPNLLLLPPKCYGRATAASNSRRNFYGDGIFSGEEGIELVVPLKLKTIINLLKSKLSVDSFDLPGGWQEVS